MEDYNQIKFFISEGLNIPYKDVYVRHTNGRLDISIEGFSKIWSGNLNRTSTGYSEEALGQIVNSFR